MKKILSLLIILCMIVSLVACGSAPISNVPVNSNGRVYKCDYKTLNINTKITTALDGEEISIVGNIFTVIIDPLTAKDSKGRVLGYAGDSYGFISQDDHGIYIDNKFDINMCGNIDMFGESYKLKDSNGVVVAAAEFNMYNTGGTIKDLDNNLIAKYSSSYFMNDYTVTIYDNNICSDLAILMIVASYVSDYMADRR
jgi:hypothetical protein